MIAKQPLPCGSGSKANDSRRAAGRWVRWREDVDWHERSGCLDAGDAARDKVASRACDVRRAAL